MAHNHIPTYISSTPSMSTGGWGINRPQGSGAGYISGPYFIGSVYIDTGIDAPAGTAASGSDPAEHYMARVAGISGATLNGPAGGQPTFKLGVDVSVVFRDQFFASPTPTNTADRIWIKADFFVSDVFVNSVPFASQVTAYRLDNLRWRLWSI